jgi:integrase
MKVSLVFYPNTAKKSSKTGKIPLYVRVRLNFQKCERRLNIDVTEQDLNKWDPLHMRFIDRSFYGNQIIGMIDLRFGQFMALNSFSLAQHTPESIMNFITGENKAKPILVTNYIEDYFKNTVVTNSNIAIGTVKNYRKANNHFKAFLLHRKTEKLTISELTNSLALEFKDFLLGNIPGKLTKGMTEPSAAGIVKKFRTIFDRAIIEGLLDKNPFKIVKLKHRSPRRGRLSIDEIVSIVRLDLNRLPAQKIYRDIFLFSAYTGLAYNDVIGLKTGNLHHLPSGEVKLTVDRTKTDVQTELFLVSQGKEILERYKDSPDRKIGDAVLPYRSNKELNLQLKYLATLANISLNLSHHISRHTYRQLLAEAGIEDMGVIKKMMGQTRKNDIDDVYYVVTERKLLQAKQKFQHYLNEHL